MSYAQSGSMLNYFHPNIPLATTTSGVLREVDIGAASGDHGEYICVKPCTIRVLKFMLVGEAASGTVTPPSVIFTKRPTPLSATSESAIGTLIIPSGTAIGKVVYKEVVVDMSVGDSVEISWVVGSGTPTGIGFAFFECEDKPEVPGNNADMIESA